LKIVSNLWPILGNKFIYFDIKIVEI